MTEIRLINTPGIIRIAVIHEQNLLDFGLWYPGYADGFDDIYLGRVDSYLPALGGAFIILGKDLSGFLPDNAGAKSLSNGDIILVRVTRSAQGGKGVRLDTRNIPDIDITNKKAPCLLQHGLTPLDELAMRWPAAPILLKDLGIGHIIPTSYKNRIHKAKDEIDPVIAQQIEELENSEIHLPRGMKATITPTPALVAIDMDGATNSNDNQSKIRSQFNANRVALPVLLHHLRLRNLSGVIIVDMVGMPSKKRRLFQPDIEQALQKDPLHPRFHSFTTLGLVEITRPRKRPPLHEQLFSDHGQAIHILASLQMDCRNNPNHYRHTCLILKINTTIHSALQRDTWAIADFERQCSITLKLEISPVLNNQQWEYYYDETNNNLSNL